MVRIVEALSHIVLRLPEPALTIGLSLITDPVVARIAQHASIAGTIEVSAPLTVEVNLLAVVFKVFLSIGSSIPDAGVIA
jgi:hypothetical protein